MTAAVKKVFENFCFETEALCARFYANRESFEEAEIHAWREKKNEISVMYYDSAPIDGGEEVENALLEAEICLMQLEHSLEEDNYWKSIQEEWDALKNTALAYIEARDGEVSDADVQYIEDRLHNYFYHVHEADPTDILCEADALDDKIRPFKWDDYQMFGLEAPFYIQPSTA